MIKKDGGRGATGNGLSSVFTDTFEDYRCVQKDSGSLKLLARSSKKNLRTRIQSPRWRCS
jgi:hypothetical protein